MKRHAKISSQDDVIDSRDIIARIEELEDERSALVDEVEALEDGTDEHADAIEELAKWDDENSEELKTLRTVAEEGESSPDWQYGESLIREDYFTRYIEDLIADCYELPKEFNSGAWPWRHMTMDYEAAAEEAKQDYFEVDLAGVTYFIRA